MIKYEIIIYWSEEDAAFIAEVPELPGCAAHGQTKTMLLAMLRMRFACGIDTAKRIWRSDPGTEGPPPDSSLTSRARRLPVIAGRPNCILVRFSRQRRHASDGPRAGIPRRSLTLIVLIGLLRLPGIVPGVHCECTAFRIQSAFKHARLKGAASDHFPLVEGKSMFVLSLPDVLVRQCNGDSPDRPVGNQMATAQLLIFRLLCAFLATTPR